ncbi:hypothetical protein LTR94_025558 [Friedmanniomyces endolithicus]|nr:hypothetical protein LTR94_025558 [Friedmanniomyces endolithicus]
MSHPLDRAVWNALTGRLASHAVDESDALAVRIDPEIGVFVAVRDRSPESQARLTELANLYPGVSLVEHADGPMADGLPEGAGIKARIGLVQMTADALTGSGLGDLEYEVLTDEDGPAMLALATLTKPGPFRSRTRKLGPFIGVKQEGRLVAMAGRRLRVEGFTELSGVCTHPDYRGRGYAAALSRAVVSEILAEGDQAFLHAFADHPATIAFYASLGFKLRAPMTYTILED